jgi:outer membrane protein OmpA-like peptidoglycan-associated protein
MFRIVFVILLSFTIFGCTSWPDEGKGGWAEIYNPDAPDQIDGYKNALPFQVANEFEHLSLKLDLLKVRGIKYCMPAQLYQAELMRNRIEREIAADMFSDAQLDLRMFYHQLHMLENHFERVVARTECIADDTNDNEDYYQRLDSLLNSDNQFATGSFELTPKFVTRLAKAAEILKMLPDTRVLLVGHTDSVGTKDDNYELAYKRAQSVKKWLVLYGVSESQIDTLAQGALAPFSVESETVSKQHSDRRVNGYILSRSKTAAELNKIIPLSKWTETLDKEESKQ